MLVVGAWVLLLLVAGYGAVSWIFSTKLIGQRFAPDEEVAFADFGLPEPEAVSLTNGPIELASWYFKNPRSVGAAVVLLHGFSINKATALSWAPLFWDLGCDLFVYDLRSHGRSSPALLTYGVVDKQDQLIAVDWLAKRTGLRDQRIGLWGVSYGAATSLQAAAVRPDLAFVVADAPYSSLVDIASFQAGQMFGAWAKAFVPGALFIAGLRARFNPLKASPQDAVRGLVTPVLLVHSTTDNFTPSVQSESIFARSDHAHTVLVLTKWGAPHGASYMTDVVAYTRLVDEFLAKFVPAFGERKVPANPRG